MKHKIRVGIIVAFFVVRSGSAQQRPETQHPAQSNVVRSDGTPSATSSQLSEPPIAPAQPTSSVGGSVSGHYVNGENPAEYLDLAADRKFVWRVGGRDFTGTYELSTGALTLRFPPLGATARGKLENGRFNCCLSNGLDPTAAALIDDESKNWVRQGESQPVSVQVGPPQPSTPAASIPMPNSPPQTIAKQAVQPVGATCLGWPFNSPTKSAKRVFGWDDDSLRLRLRASNYFCISLTDVSDPELLAFIKANEQEIATLLLQVDYGEDVKRFLQGSPLLLGDRDFFDTIGRAHGIADTLSQVVDVLNALQQSAASEITSESLQALTAILMGIQIYQLAAQVSISQEVRAVLDDYCGLRHDSNLSKEQTWAQIQGNPAYTRPLDQLSLVTKIPKEQIGAWFENAYVAYRLVGYSDSNEIRWTQGRALANLAKGSQPGDSGARLGKWSNPSFSPDGNKVAFLGSEVEPKSNRISKTRLYIANLQTKGLFCFPEILTDSASTSSSVTIDRLVTPRFTPDGTKILLGGIRPQQPAGNAGVFLSNLDGTSVQRLFECGTCAGFQGNGIGLSSNGQLIAFVHGESGLQPGPITLVDMQGRALWSFPTDVQERVDPTLSFSPEGSEILFASFHSITLKARIFLANLQTHSLQMLQEFQYPSLYSPDIKSPFFSPDGRQIVFSAAISLPGDPKGEPRYHVFKADVASGRRTMLTSDEGVDPVFLPNGMQIMFLSVETKTSGVWSNSGIYIMDATGRNRRQVVRTSGTGEVKFVVSPDGKKFVYSDGPWGQSDLFLVSIDGTNRTRLRDLLK